MAREKIDDMSVEQVVGGSIIFSTDHTTCGLNRYDQCKVLNYDACIKFIADNYKDLKEAEMMRKMVALGYIVKL
ncbi:hypothetical protein JS518_03745 [Clostridiales bacterium FE2010]|nr:hypothetical protein JS518_03745 [Clostridiales bacterium FE2010]